MPEATVNGVETHYEVQGEGTPVVFIHGGFGGTASTILPQPPRAVTSILPQDRVRLVTYDRRCAGQSQYALEQYSLEDLAADARALLDHLGIDRSIVIGDSVGGMVAQQYALEFPEHVTALCLLETGPDLMSHTEWGTRFAEITELARREGDRALFEHRKHELRSPPEPEAGAMRVGPASAERERFMRERREALAAVLAELPDEELFTYSTGEIRNFSAFIGYDFTPRLSELTMPAAVIHGNADTVVPFEYGQALHAGIPASEFHEIDDATHGLLMYPDAQEALRDWALRVAVPD